VAVQQYKGIFGTASRGQDIPAAALARLRPRCCVRGVVWQIRRPVEAYGTVGVATRSHLDQIDCQAVLRPKPSKSMPPRTSKVSVAHGSAANSWPSISSAPGRTASSHSKHWWDNKHEHYELSCSLVRTLTTASAALVAWPATDVLSRVERTENLSILVLPAREWKEPRSFPLLGCIATHTVCHSDKLW
jgi:hypothetical protein